MKLENIKKKIALGNVDKIPPGWETSLQVQKKSDLSSTQVRKILLDGIKMGVVERRAFRIFDGVRTVPVMHYREKT